MKRMTAAASLAAAALLATIAFAEVTPRDETPSPTDSKRYLPTGSDATGGFGAGAFTLPPSY